jgi:flagellar biosynthesis protein FlhB
MNFLLRLLLVIAGLIFAVSLAVAMVILLLVWAVRALWFKLTGRSVSPFVMRMNPLAGFEQVFRQGSKDSAQSPRRKLDDVTDVEPKP